MPYLPCLDVCTVYCFLLNFTTDSEVQHKFPTEKNKVYIILNLLAKILILEHELSNIAIGPENCTSAGLSLIILLCGPVATAQTRAPSKVSDESWPYIYSDYFIKDMKWSYCPSIYCQWVPLKSLFSEDYFKWTKLNRLKNWGANRGGKCGLKSWIGEMMDGVLKMKDTIYDKTILIGRENYR